MTHDEMIAVIQAHKEGKRVQSRPKGDNIEWMDELQPLFDFEEYDWRIKPEPHYRSFKNANEVEEAIKVHGDWIIDSKEIINSRFKIIGYNDKNVSTMQMEFYDYDYAFKDYVFALDRTPFGIKEE